ncbi:hypothetical protein DFH08DRAFT_799705 [Mycena albidolilacea]|uniref:Uncharacterized protein n=1 Tax=Mycena albidolilacea TaxID=1033008 RepID=A0AAD7F184_9AGAR|nr:hypothetical protein DFH08DRAFT_799705 [Mycena albidolilacea]
MEPMVTAWQPPDQLQPLVTVCPISHWVASSGCCKASNGDSDYEQLDRELKEDKEEAEEEAEEEVEAEKGSDREWPAKHFKDPTPPTEITYNINSFSASDMLKLGKKPQPKGSAILKLLDNFTFARFEWKLRSWGGCHSSFARSKPFCQLRSQLLRVPKARIEKVLFCDVLEEFLISQRVLHRFR